MRPEDTFDVYGKHVAHKLRGLKGDQVTFAQKLMNDVLFEAELGMLTRDYQITRPIQPSLMYASPTDYPHPYSHAPSVCPAPPRSHTPSSVSFPSGPWVPATSTVTNTKNIPTIDCYSKPLTMQSQNSPVSPINLTEYYSNYNVE